MPRNGKTTRDLNSGAHARLLANRSTTRAYNQRRSEPNSSKVLDVPAHFNGKRSKAHKAFALRHRK